MSKLSSAEYKKLDDVSSTDTHRDGGPFLSVFIPTEPREGQTPGQLHCQIWDLDTHLFAKKESIYFIPMFIKKIKVWEERVKKDGNEKTIVRYFCWDPDRVKRHPPQAKVQYIIAGVYVDDNVKVVKDPRTEGQAAFIYFRCKGVKMAGAIEYMNALSEKAKKIEPLSDDQNFERNVVTPRRFVTRVTVGTEKTDFGRKYIFKFNPEKLLPDALVIGDEKRDGIMKQCMQWADAFKNQFDITEYVSEGGSVDDSDAPEQEEPPAKNVKSDYSSKKKSEQTDTQVEEISDGFSLLADSDDDV